LGQKDITEITREDVTTLVYKLLGDGKARGTVKLIVAPLRGMFNAVLALSHVATNPAQRLFRRTRKDQAEQQDKITFLRRDEVDLLLTTCQSHYAAYYPLILTLARTGLRIGECLAVRWEDVDFAGQFIEVRHTLFRNRLSSPKSGKSRRVDMSRQLTDTLKALLLERKKETLRRGWGELPPWVFANSHNNPLDADFFRRVWRKLLAQAGLRYVNVHTLRHTFASLLLQSGAPIVYVKQQLGHASIQMTVDIYGHLEPGGNRDLMDRLDTPSLTTNRNPSATNTINDVPKSRKSA
jgi:integrase